ncbi:M56 family metallopeptidase, partial [Modestobacter roseus]
MLPATATALAVLAALLAWPVPAALARAGWARRDPLAALVCWQAIGLAGGLSIIGALLVHGLAPWGHSLPEAWWHWVTRQPAVEPVRGDHWVAQTLAAVLALELLGVLALSWVRTARTRRRHRELLELVVRPGSSAPDPDETLLLDHPAPVAFCIPGARPLLVLSSGMVAELPGEQLAAVVAHERAHLREHHHLLLLPFVAWRAALPVLPAADRAHDAVRDLVEMRADDVALTALPGPDPRRTLAAAIVASAGGAGGGVPAGALAVTGGAVA